MLSLEKLLLTGELQYINKHNSNYSDIESLVNLLEQDVLALKAAGKPGSDLDFRLASQNLLINGGFDFWQRGTAVRPDLWQRENEVSFTVQRSTEQLKLNTYSVKTTDTGDLSQKLQEELRLGLDSAFSLSFGCYVHADTADKARVGIYNGITTQWSQFHAGDSTWQFLFVPLVQGAGSIPTEIKFVLQNLGATVYWNAAVVIRGNPAAGPVFIANDKTLEEMRVLSYFETDREYFAGVGYLNTETGDRELTNRVRFKAPKRDMPTVTIDELVTGFDYDVYDVDRCGFTLTVMELGGSSGTDGFELPGVLWEAEVSE